MAATTEIPEATGRRVTTRHAGIDGLRGLAVLLVLLSHLFEASYIEPPPFLAFFFQGNRGVTMFFVISGFLITTILQNERAKSGRVSLRAFYLRRSLRILPAFYTYLAVVVILSLLSTPVDVSGGQVAASGLFVWNYAPIEHGWWLGHTWSLAVEEQFYLLWPLALIFLPPRILRWAAVVTILVLPVLRTGQYFLLPGTREQITIMFHTRADSLLMGCMLALVATSVPWVKVLPWVRRCWPAYVAYLVVIGPIAQERFEGAYLLTVGYTLESLCVVGIIATITSGDRPVLGRVLGWRPLVLVGLISYSLYLWQQLFTTNLMPAPIYYAWVAVPASFAAAVASYWLVEKPFLRRKKRFERGAADFQPGI